VRGYLRRKSLAIAIMGQSNAGGGGTQVLSPIYEVPYRQYYSTDPDQIDVYVTDWGPTKTRTGDHLGAEFGFADRALDDGILLSIDKWAVAGTSIPRWLPSANDLYPQALAATVRGYNTSPIARKYDAIFWWQGEGDAGLLANALAYGTRLGVMSDAFRADWSNPNLIVCAVRLRADSPRPFTAEERASLEAWSATNPALNRWINVDDLPVKPDGIHYDASSLIEAGKRGYDEITAAL